MVVVVGGWTQAVGVRALTSALPKRLRPGNLGVRGGCIGICMLCPDYGP